MSAVTIHGITYETIYDTETEISIPIPCNDDSPSINNINLSGLNFIITKNPNNLWNEESLTDFKDFLENPPADKIFVGIGEIILSPQNNPNQYYKFNQTKTPQGKTYITVEKLQTLSKRKKEMKKTKKPVKTTKPTKTTKTSVNKKKNVQTLKKTPIKKQTVKLIKTEKPAQRKRKTVEPQQKLILEEPVKSKRKQQTLKEESDAINPQCFFLLKMAEAMEEYCKITFPADVKKYRKLTK